VNVLAEVREIRCAFILIHWLPSTILLFEANSNQGSSASRAFFPQGRAIRRRGRFVRACSNFLELLDRMEAQ